MIDRIEELLGQPAEEDDDGREDVQGAAAPAPFPRAAGADMAGAGTAGQAAEPFAKRMEEQGGGRTAADGTVWTAEAPGAAAGGRAQEPRMDSFAETAGAAGAVQSLTPAGRGGMTAEAGGKWAAQGGGTADPAPEGESRGTRGQAALEGLYRQTVQAARSAAPALPREQGGQTVRREGADGTAPLDVDGLDRAVRRDSWRYDGGMSIY